MHFVRDTKAKTRIYVEVVSRIYHATKKFVVS